MVCALQPILQTLLQSKVIKRVFECLIDQNFKLVQLVADYFIE